MAQTTIDKIAKEIHDILLALLESRASGDGPDHTPKLGFELTSKLPKDEIISIAKSLQTIEDEAFRKECRQTAAQLRDKNPDLIVKYLREKFYTNGEMNWDTVVRVIVTLKDVRALVAATANPAFAVPFLARTILLVATDIAEFIQCNGGWPAVKDFIWKMNWKYRLLYAGSAVLGVAGFVALVAWEVAKRKK